MSYVRVLNGVALTTADVYCFICDTTDMKEVNVTVRNVGSGTPVGTWQFDICNEPQAAADYWTEQETGTRLGSSSTANWVTLDAPTTVHGSSLTLGGGVNQSSSVGLVLGLGSYLRVWYDYSSGGSAASLGYVHIERKK